MTARRVPAALIGLFVVAAASLVSGAPAWLRIVPMLGALVVVPGLSLVHGFGRRLPASALTWALAAGSAWLVLGSQVLLYSGWWKPAALLPASLGVSAVALGFPRIRSAALVTIGRLGRLGLAMSFPCAAVVQVWAIYHAPYTADELARLQSAWTWSERSRGATGRLALSATSLLEAVVIPFRRPSTGTLLASRWLGLGLLVTAVGQIGRASCRERV